jgi:hypothetical protein
MAMSASLAKSRLCPNIAAKAANHKQILVFRINWMPTIAMRRTLCQLLFGKKRPDLATVGNLTDFALVKTQISPHIPARNVTRACY